MYRARYRRILWFFGSTLLSFAWWDLFLPRLGLRRLAQGSRSRRLRRFATDFRQLAVQMGGVMIKVGQFLSARLDVLPLEVTEELSGLQDEDRPETFEAIRTVVEAEFHLPLSEKFSEFNPIPVASASIGQVHSARLRLPGGAASSPVMVKVQRPRIEALVATDLAALRVVGGWLHRYPPIHKRANMPALLEEFTHSLYEEMDYLAEGKNAEVFAANFGGREDVRVPQVYWSHTTRRVLTLEDVQGIKITHYAAIEASGVSRAEVANRLLDTYLKQIFEDHFFHADPHPGNLFVLPLAPQAQGESAESEPGATRWQLAFVDFGMVGHVTPNQLTGLRELLIAAATQDAARMIKGYQLLDALLPEADLDLLEKASNRAFERLWGKSTTEMMKMQHEEAVQFAREFSGLIYNMPFQVPENLILLGRSLGILSGICTGLNPDFNVWHRVAPYAQKLAESEGGSKLETWVREVGDYAMTLLSLPRRAENLLRRMEQGQLEVRAPELKEQFGRLDRSLRRLVDAVLFAVFALGGLQFYLIGQTAISIGMAGVALLVLLWMLLAE